LSAALAVADSAEMGVRPILVNANRQRQATTAGLQYTSWRQ
jgi:hypothetical protein